MLIFYFIMSLSVFSFEGHNYVVTLISPESHCLKRFKLSLKLLFIRLLVAARNMFYICTFMQSSDLLNVNVFAFVQCNFFKRWAV